MKKINKYRNKKVIYKGIKFDSMRERNYFLKIELLEEAGLIKDLEIQKKFILQKGFKLNGKSRREISYIADFYFYDVKKQKYRVIDVKGYRTDVYKIKKKLFESKYQIEIEEV